VSPWPPGTGPEQPTTVSGPVLSRRSRAMSRGDGGWRRYQKERGTACNRRPSCPPRTLLGWRAGGWLSRPGNAIDLVRLTVGRGSWATICWRWRAAHPSWRSSHPTASVACSFLGVELVSHVIARTRPAGLFSALCRRVLMHPLMVRFSRHRRLGCCGWRGSRRGA
jgi:hypothetical protein